MSAENLGTSVGSTLFPTVPVQRCSEILRFLMEHVDTLWPATAALDTVEKALLAPVAAAPVRQY
jgi:hypothetical protein